MKTAYLPIMPHKEKELKIIQKLKNQKIKMPQEKLPQQIKSQQ